MSEKIKKASRQHKINKRRHDQEDVEGFVTSADFVVRKPFKCDVVPYW